jgi:cobalt-zinc-cadmium efflux system membrane fusion protein
MIHNSTGAWESIDHDDAVSTVAALGRLLPSMYAAVEVLSDPDDLVIAIPLSALVTGKTSDWVYVNMGDHHYQKRLVKVGSRLKDRALIHEGLNPGEHVVIEGALLLRAEQGSNSQKRQDKS